MAVSQTEDVRKLAKDGYDQSAERYLEWTSQRPGHRISYCEKLLQYVQDAGTTRVLELGCGAGVPCTEFLAERCGHVTANDISSTQIALAKQKLSGCKNVDFVEGDMTELEFPDERFDVITAFFSIIHLDPAGQRSMLKKIRRWLKPNGFFLCNLAGAESQDGGTVEEDWLGMRAYWSSFGRAGNLQLVRDEGLEILEQEVIEEVGDAQFLWIIAKAKQEK